MSTVSLTSASSDGLQQLLNRGILPNNISSDTLKTATPSQLNQLAQSNIQSQQLNSLLGYEKTISDSATLSTTASDALNQAVNNQLTSNLDAAVMKFLPTQQPETGVSRMNLLA